MSVCLSDRLFENYRMEAFFVQPPASSVRDVFSTPFSTNLWITLASSFVLVCIVVSVYKTCFKTSEDFEIAILDVILWQVACICQKGWVIVLN